MKHLSLLFVSILMAWNVFAGNTPREVKKVTEGGYTYETVTNDPLNARIYTLANGLKVYLTVYKNKPRIQTYIAVKAGSKFDPADATGLAHYLEHMVFKGTSKLGSGNWAKEKPLLDKIEALFEVYRKTTDTAQRRKIYRQIDSVSVVASQFAIANEYDKILSALGADGTNAYTWVEQTVYVNDIPSNEIEKWAKIESERFGELTPRLFHTELEAVYEEKNRGLDNDTWKIWETMFANLFPEHQYGKQTTIGTVEHLKNPSITAIKKYFDTYYVPNNMAICLSGDLDPTKTIKTIDQYFGKLKTKTVPGFTPAVLSPIAQPVAKTVVGPEAESINIGFRFPGNKSKESLQMEMLSMVLANGQAGLFDINLNQKQKVLGASAFPLRLNDYSALMLNAKAKEGQSLEEVQKLLLDEVEKIKKGEFEEDLLVAIINDYKKSEMKKFESNNARADAFVDAFVAGKEWKDAISETDYLASLTKKDLVAFANQYLKDNYVVIYKKTGVDSTIKKVVKPSITPVELNRENQSEFLKGILAKPSPALAPVFIDYKKDIVQTQLKNGTKVLSKRNTENGLFDLYYVLNTGTNDNPKLSLAVSYLEYLGTPKFTAEQLKKEFYKLGCSYSVSTSEDRVYVSLSGLDENFSAALTLFEELLAAPKPDEKALKELVNDILKIRRDNKKNKGLILRGGLASYAKYGEKSPFTNIISEEELQKIQPKDLIELITSMLKYEHKVLYYGPKDEKNLGQILDKIHYSAPKPLALPTPKKFEEKPIDKTVVYWTNYDMVQAEIVFLSKSIPYSTAILPQATLYNEYFSGNMSSIVFTELRESKALAYSVNSRYAVTNNKEKSNYVSSYIGTQADKLAEAMKGMNALLNALPESPALFENSKKSILSSIETERIIKADVLFNYEGAQKLGLDSDIRQMIYEKVKQLTFADIKKFQSDYVSQKPQAILVIGNKDKLNFEELKKYGEVKELTLKELFGY